MGIIHGRTDIHWRYLVFFSVVHILGIYGLWYAFSSASAGVVVFAIVYFYLAHLSITVGAHRLYAHESFRASRSLQYLIVLLFSATFQGPILWWAAKHKHHHATEDMPGDPHSPHVDGFWYAHIGWLLSRRGLEPAPKQYHRTFYRREEDDSLRYAPAHWQGERYFVLAPLMTFGVPIVAGFLLGDWWGGLMVGGFARLMLQYHLTWVVNSVGHMWGTHLDGRSTNIWSLALLTVGESFHANHHQSPGDYRLGRKWWEFDLGTYTIDLLARLGMVSDRRIPNKRTT